MADPSRHALVIGAGIFGATAALELAERGWTVTLVDRFGDGEPGPHPRASSTDVSKVIRMDYGADRFFTSLAGEAMSRWDGWNARFSRPLFHRTGFLLLSRTPLADGFEADSFRALREAGEPVERVSADALRERFPAWNGDLYPDGYLNRAAGWAESGEVVAEVLAWCRAAGVAFLDGAVQDLAPAGSSARVTVATSTGKVELGPDLVVVAAGAWTHRLLPTLGGGIEARAMPVVHVRPRDPAPFRAHHFPVWGADISRTGWYGFPLREGAGARGDPAGGYVKIGHHGRGWDDDPDTADTLPAGFENGLRSFLADSLPGLADGEIVHRRVCFYADARDGAFWIDRVPDSPGVVVASGGSGHGFKFGPLLGDLIANAAEGVADERLTPLRWRPEAGHAREDARADSEVWGDT